jgi:hypothetical protein
LIFMGEPRATEINASKRILRQEGSVCGGIITGTDKIRSGFGNGDCLYFDFERMVFAAADGSERFPRASRDLLNRLHESLSRLGVPGTVAGWKDLVNDEVFTGQQYQHRTTFSCAAIRTDESGISIIIAHGGDSAVTVMDPVTGAIVFQTGRDMNFAGRSRAIDDVSEHRLESAGVRVLITTDGFGDFLRISAIRSPLAGAMDIFAASPLERAGERMHAVLRESNGGIEHDDIGFMIIDPFRVRRDCGGAVIIGGTRPHEEEHFLKEYADGSRDRWIAARDWSDSTEELSGAGIEVLGYHA